MSPERKMAAPEDGHRYITWVVYPGGQRNPYAVQWTQAIHDRSSASVSQQKR